MAGRGGLLFFAGVGRARFRWKASSRLSPWNVGKHEIVRGEVGSEVEKTVIIRRAYLVLRSRHEAIQKILRMARHTILAEFLPAKMFAVLASTFSEGGRA